MLLCYVHMISCAIFLLNEQENYTYEISERCKRVNLLFKKNTMYNPTAGKDIQDLDGNSPSSFFLKFVLSVTDKNSQTSLFQNIKLYIYLLMSEAAME